MVKGLFYKDNSKKSSEVKLTCIQTEKPLEIQLQDGDGRIYRIEMSPFSAMSLACEIIEETSPKVKKAMEELDYLGRK